MRVTARVTGVSLITRTSAGAAVAGADKAVTATAVTSKLTSAIQHREFAIPSVIPPHESLVGAEHARHVAVLSNGYALLDTR
ncbi:hypothetical protein GCM10009764_51670 [Nocardia ninae]|uniref:Uncharacterized protein n=1 Tax=Nocardia ninae NBRC 108245 TaxID=1210091 RepID=A0A511M5Z5_9NOCA|nr:hypothetical protein NN4_05580 [Nocardia ninae NBRC 108245]